MIRPALPFHEFRLDNGLRVIVHTDAHAPVSTVNLWYRVGSADERPGRTGLAHLFEHLMFEGSAHVPAGRFDELLEAVGGASNGSTSPDRTNYWETVPPHALDLPLWLESDRMGWLPDALTQAKLDAQRGVVKNERRQNYENQPYGLAGERLLSALYPADHPYSWPTIGSMADLDATTLDDAIAFFRTYYAPANASLAIAGPTPVEEVRRRVESWFGELPGGRAVPVPRPRPTAMPGELRLAMEDEVVLPRLYAAWHSPAIFADGDAALDCAGHALGEGKASRLYNRLVRELQLAQDVDAEQRSGRLGSTFVIELTARPDVRLDELLRVTDVELAALAADVTDQELERAKNAVLTGLISVLQRVGGFGGRADRLNMYAQYTDDPGYLDRDVARYATLAPTAVVEAVRRWLSSPRVLLSVVPHGRLDLALEGSSV
jgi:zinc protease